MEDTASSEKLPSISINKFYPFSTSRNILDETKISKVAPQM